MWEELYKDNNTIIYGLFKSTKKIKKLCAWRDFDPNKLRLLLKKVKFRNYMLLCSKYGGNCLIAIVRADDLPTKPNYDAYKSLLNGCKNPISFYSPHGTLLVVPCPRKGMNAVNIKYFTNYPNEWEKLWKLVLSKVKKGNYIATHGYSVHWLHIRITKTIPPFYSKKIRNIFKFYNI